MRPPDQALQSIIYLSLPDGSGFVRLQGFDLEEHYFYTGNVG
jgi:hypothetical protein